MKINDKIIEALVDQVGMLFKDYREEIEEAYCNGNEKLSFSVSFKLAPKKGAISVATKLNLVPRKISDTVEYLVDEVQGRLPGM